MASSTSSTNRSTGTESSSIEGPTYETYNILLIGETGSGKSTLINYLTNYFRNGSLRSLKIAIPTQHLQATEEWEHSEKSLDDPTKSKTAKSTSYGFSKDGLHYAFIDTPGLSDTSGPDKDTEHILNIMDIAANKGTIAAIMLIINGSVARATVNLRNTIARMKSSVPDILLNNLIVVLTNCSSSSVNFDLRQLEPWTVPKDNVFYMNNSALSKPVSDWIDDEDKLGEVTYLWKKSMKEINKMMSRINQLGPIASNAFQEMRKQRNEIKKELDGNLSAMRILNKLYDKLLELKKDAATASTNIQAYSNYKQSMTIEFDSLEVSDEYNVICKNCKIVCCHGCLSPFGTGWCSRFDWNYICKICQHGVNQHYSANLEPITVTKNVESVLDGAKEIYERSTKQKAEIGAKINSIDYDIEALNYNIDTRTKNIRECCMKLKAICSQFNFADELATTIDSMKIDMRSLVNPQARALAEANIENIKNIANLLNTTT